MDMATWRHRWGDPGTWRRLAPWLVVLVFAAWGYRSVLPPDPQGSDAPEDSFSATRALEHVRTIADKPHPMGSTAIADVRSYIVAQLNQLGMNVDLQTSTARDFFGNAGSVEIVNIVAAIPGTDSTKAVAFLAHYDTVPATPGANDNTAAVAALIETGRALMAGPALRNDVLLVFTDAEEPEGRAGATAFANGHPLMQTIGLAVNLESSGGSGASVLAETNGPQFWIMRELAAADPHPAAFSIITEIARLLGPIGTDFDVLQDAGVSGFHFAYLHGSPIYHTEADNIDAVNWGSLQHHGQHVLSIATHFGNLALDSAPPSGDAVFFSIQPLFVIYPTAWVWPITVLVIAVSALALLARLREPGVRPAGMVGALATTAATGLLVAIAGTIAWLGIVAIRSTPGVVESYLYFLLLLGLAAGFVARIARRNPEFGYGILLLWVLLTVLTAWIGPRFSYAFAWPALAAAAALLWKPPADWQRLLRLTLVTAPTMLLLIPPVDLIFQFSQPRPGNPGSEVAAVFLVPILLGLLGVGLLRTVWPGAGHRGT